VQTVLKQSPGGGQITATGGDGVLYGILIEAMDGTAKLQCKYAEQNSTRASKGVTDPSINKNNVEMETMNDRWKPWMMDETRHGQWLHERWAIMKEGCMKA
jgi:hypothetical protein